MANIRGERPTVAQIRMLREHGFDWKDYLFLKMEFIDPNTGEVINKKLGKNRNKVKCYKFINRVTGVTIRIPEGE